MTSLFDFAAFPVLTTDRLILRQLTHHDAEAMTAIFGSPEVLRFLNNDPVDTREKAIGMIDWLAQNYQDQRGIDWGITRRADDRMIGMCGLYDWDRENRHIDLGYHIVPAEWGKGFASEAARALITWAFDRLDVHRIQADCTAGNDASERVMIKCGFTFEGIRREHFWEHGRFVDNKYYGLLRHEFKGA